ncbi:hypothetical protein [Polyangium fumosum]|uniref:CHAT domain-containing protein n=1 Tax=Polyangium fumosum TaxID=889272 RepID=A0A4U1IUT8_9BACT|nr:hypothetical protein [Polyangium fumosum]TKC98199.1 hypothetical protein E8A74_42095 [Polyangium fumosum]
MKGEQDRLDQYTYCMCLVLNTTDESTLLDGFLYRSILSGMKGTWEKHHDPGTFHYLCPYDDEHKFTKSFGDALSIDVGPRPLIIVTGHCRPGGKSITTDDSRHEFDLHAVYNIVSPFLPDRIATVFHSQCSTGLSDGEKPSFQERFDRFMYEYMSTDRYYSIGTLSTSVPFLGKLHATGLTFAYKGTPLSQAQYLEQLQAFTGT